jgi:hypothetical protein
MTSKLPKLKTPGKPRGAGPLSPARMHADDNLWENVPFGCADLNKWFVLCEHCNGFTYRCNCDCERPDGALLGSAPAVMRST